MLLKVFRALLQIGNAFIILALLKIHFIDREESFGSSLNFYLFPLPVIIGVVLVLTLFLKVKRYNLILAALLMMFWMLQSFKFHIPNTIEATDLEITFWNASRENTFEDAFHENGGIPDVMVLAEMRDYDLKALKTNYPDYFFYSLGREICIFSKTAIDLIKNETSKYGSTVIQFKTRGLNFYAVDVQGSTDVPRAWELGFVAKQITQTRNTVVLGDFNTPYESIYLKPVKTTFNHAFNKKGNGFRETWFYNIPLLSLDHIWASKDLKILKTKKVFTTKSDHSMLKTYIKM